MHTFRRLSAAFLFSYLASLSCDAAAQDELWKSYTNMRNVVGAVGIGDDVWAATTGGLLHWQSGAGTFEQITNTEGLDLNTLTAIGKDNRGRIWLGLEGGMINILDPVTKKISRINDFRGFQINTFWSQNDSMFIGLNIGVSLYLIDRSEVKETYKTLGTLPVQTAVRHVIVRGRELWAATASGVARTSLDFVNLSAPQNWTNYYTAHGLPSVNVRSFASRGGEFYAGTASGVAKWTGTTWINVSGNIGSGDILRLALGENGTLYAATSSGIYQMTSEAVWSLVATNRNGISGVFLTDTGKLWGTTRDVGLLEYQASDNSWTIREPNGPGSNNVSSVAVDEQGILWCISRDKGMSVFDGTRWRTFNESNGAFWNDYLSVYIDETIPETRWFGTGGRGLVRVTGPLDNLQFTKFDTANGFLVGANNAPIDFVVVAPVKRDLRNVLWIVNWNPANSSPVVYLDQDESFGRFSTNEGLRSQRITDMEIDNANRVWLASEDGGISVIDHNNTLSDHSDDRQGQGLGNEDGLASTWVTSLAEDQDGIMWIGTNNGLNSWFPRPEPVSNHYGLISDDIRVVRVDPQNNKWIGTSSGISILSGRDNFTLTHFTIQNSPLVSNSITSFSFNGNTGDAYIGTTNGLSVYRSQFTSPRSDLTQLKGYPNPFILDGSGETFTVTNLTKAVQVKIFNEIGELVRSFSQDDIPGGFALWDGKNDDGNLVGSGIYLVVAYNDQGQTGFAKVAVINR
jgi:ligand-binding sensor domain-containing protein